jgi:GNAT superfamily N-acetyltransferase
MHLGVVAGKSLAGRLFGYAVAGTLGDLIVRGASRVGPRLAPGGRRLAVRAVAQGIVVGRRLGAAAEETRLRAGDVVADARASLGEEAPPPSAEPLRDDHGHEH